MKTVLTIIIIAILVITFNKKKMNKIEIYTTPQCGFCQQLKQTLKGKNIEYIAHDVTSDDSAREEMVNISGAMSVPVTIINKYTDNQKVGVGIDQSMEVLGLKASSQDQKQEEGKVTCPECKSMQDMKIPTNACVPYYKCNSCGKTISAKDEDCCVFCSYGDKPCPLKDRRERAAVIKAARYNYTPQTPNVI